MTNRKKYFLSQDNSCHWYAVLADKKKEWDEWANLDEEDEASWNVPDFASGIDSPSEVQFFLD